MTNREKTLIRGACRSIDTVHRSVQAVVTAHEGRDERQAAAWRTRAELLEQAHLDLMAAMEPGGPW